MVSPQPAITQGPSAGTVLLGKYELVRPLGEGGMGVVWVACDRVLNVEVAVKLIQRPDSEWSKFAERALTEARLAAKIAHPAVCRAIDFGFAENLGPFVVSELLIGENLEALLARDGRMPPIQAVRTLLPILDALQLAHDNGIVHRDVKPANLFLAQQGPQRLQPKLLDFGIARWADDKKRTTITGSVMGTPDYMSPEQARGSKDIDSRSDLWSFCATLYEAVSGASPFDGDNPNAILWAIQSVDPPPITQLSVAEPWLSAIISRGMQRSRALRWQTAAELGRELTRWLLAHSIETDVCGQSLRARLVDGQGRPIDPADVQRSEPERTGSRRSAPSLPVRIRVRPAWIAAAFASGALLMAGWKMFGSPGSNPTIPTTVPVLERSPARALSSIAGTARTSAAEEAAAATVEAPSQPRVIPRDTSAARTPRASQRSAPTVTELQPDAVTEMPAGEIPAAEVEVPPPPPVAKPRPRATNALGYDFGL